MAYQMIWPDHITVQDDGGASRLLILEGDCTVAIDMPLHVARAMEKAYRDATASPSPVVAVFDGMAQR